MPFEAREAELGRKVNLQTIIKRSVFAMVVLGATHALAQSVVTPKPASPAPQQADSTPPANSNLPDACKLLAQADLEALFPGRPITSKGPTLSPVYKGPQYNESCMYVVRLPNPTSKSDVAKFASVTIVQWGKGTDGREGSIKTFASIRATQEKVAADPKLNLRIESLSGVGDDAFQDVSSSRVAIRVRKADLIFVVSLDAYSPQTVPNAIALATQAAKRWSLGGMVETATSIAPNSGVDIPEDTRVSTVAPADQWPDACALLTLEDVRAVFGDMTIDQPRKMMGQIKHESRIDRVEALPHPISCLYPVRRTDLVGGERKIVTHDVQLSVKNLASTLEFSKRFYNTARKVGDAKTELAGIGDESSIDVMNRIYIRKGLLMVELRVGGGQRDRDQYNDARMRVHELAKRVATKLP